jgi:hypothetical protein
LQLHDCPGEFTLDRAKVIGALNEIRKTKLALVENFETDAIATWKAFCGKIHPELVNLI